MTLQAKFQALKTELENIVVERSEQIEGSLAAILSGSHVLFLGEPGTAKSLLTNKVCEAIENSQYFQWLLTKFSTPEELYGPYSLKGLENDEYRRIVKGKLPEANIAFLDEIFKANSAILNSLLTLINERKFHNDGKAQPVPLISCFGASNELPQGEELGALYDRFVLRYWVRSIQDDGNFQSLLNGVAGSGSPTTKLSIDDIKQAQAEVAAVKVPVEILNHLRDIQKDLVGKGIKASDRRWKTCVQILKAFAWLRGNVEVTSDELEVLADCLWHNPDDRKVIFESVSPFANPLNLKAIEFLDSATEVFENWNKGGRDKLEGMTASKTLKEILTGITKEVRDRPDNKTKKLREVSTTVAKLQSQIIQYCMYGD